MEKNPWSKSYPNFNQIPSKNQFLPRSYLDEAWIIEDGRAFEFLFVCCPVLKLNSISKCQVSLVNNEAWENAPLVNVLLKENAKTLF